MKHTPGNWIHEAGQIVSRNTDGHLMRPNSLALVMDPNGGNNGPWPKSPQSEEQTANALLFAAASDLAEAAIEFMRKVDAGQARSTHSYNAFKAALKKAGVEL